MDFSLNLFTEKEIMIIGTVIGMLVLMVLILTFIDILSKKKKENEELDMMFNDFDRYEPELVKKNVAFKVEENIDESKVEISTLEENQKKIESVANEKVVEEKKQTIVVKPVKEEVKVEVESKVENKVDYIEPLIMDIEEDKIAIEESSKNKAIEELLKIEEEVKNSKSLEDTLYDLEVMEEENAIISYQELLENTRKLNTVIEDNEDEPISLTEILNMYEDKSENDIIDVDKEMSKTTLNDAYKGDFTSSPYLSPIVGFEYEKNVSCDLAEIQLENTANLEKLDKEMRKTNEFLSILNDLKKNLD